MKSEAHQSLKVLFKNINRIIGRIVNAYEVLTLIGCIGALTLLLIGDVIARTFFQSLYFADEISEFLVILTTFSGLSYAVRKARHIRMGAFFDLMSPLWEKIFIIVISAVSALVMFIMSYASYEYVLNSFVKAHETPALRIPFWIYYIIVPVGFFMGGVQYIRTIIKNMTEKETWMSAEQQSEYEDNII